MATVSTGSDAVCVFHPDVDLVSKSEDYMYSGTQVSTGRMLSYKKQETILWYVTLINHVSLLPHCVGVKLDGRRRHRANIKPC